MSSDGGLRGLFREHVLGCQWTVIETGLISPGTPDSEYCLQGGESGWIEFKKTDGWAVTLRPAQVAWITERALRGGRALIGVRRLCEPGKRRAGADELWLVAGWAARAARRHGLRGLPPGALLGRWGGGADRWNWRAVRHVLAAAPGRPPGSPAAGAGGGAAKLPRARRGGP